MTSAEIVHQTDSSGANRRCDNPDCTSRLSWTDGRGRPQLFCSDAYRKRARYAAARLIRQVREQEKGLNRDGITYRQTRAAMHELSRLKWLLSAYPASTRED